MKKALLGLLAVIVLVVGAAALYVGVVLPAKRPASTEKIEATPERLARGKYLTEHVGGCLHCHSGVDTGKWGLPAREGAVGAGAGFCWDATIGFAGKLCPSNITSDPETGLGRWTDGEILRALREGVRADGTALFPIMPYQSLSGLSDEDARAMVAYLRTLAPVKNPVPARMLEPPLNVIVKLMPKPLEGPVAAPDRQDKVAYGKYLVRIAGCEGCHTPVNERHEPLPGMAFAGGQEFKFPWGGSVRSSNLSPDDTGIGAMTREGFISLFKAYADPAARAIEVDPKENTVMPWLVFSGMTEEDLGAIYDYLRTVPKVKNSVEKRTVKLPEPAPAAEPVATPEADAGAPSDP